MNGKAPCLAVIAALALLLTACAGRNMPEDPASIPQDEQAMASVPPLPDDRPLTSGSAPQTPSGEETVEMQTVEHAPIPQQSIPDEVAGTVVGSSWDENNPVPLEELVYLQIPYLDFDGERQLGEIIVHRSLADEVQEIFAELYEAGYPIAGMRLIDAYEADDQLSMAANNTYAFCSRLIMGTDRYSQHAYGVAIDINPLQNPYVVQGGVYPEAAREYLDRGDIRPGMIVPGGVCYDAFVSRGWTWGGDWPNPDYQHFEKTIN